MFTTIIKFNIVVSIQSDIQSSTQINAPDVLQQLNQNISDLVASFGFIAIDFNPRISNRNDGWAFYRTYVLTRADNTIKLIIDIRTADHPSRPALAIKNEKRLAALSQEGAPAHVMDIYYKDRNWGVQYFVGKGNEYSDPVTSLSQVDDIVSGQLHKIVDKYIDRKE